MLQLEDKINGQMLGAFKVYRFAFVNADFIFCMAQ
jgi:hypothetical protein